MSINDKDKCTISIKQARYCQPIFLTYFEARSTLTLGQERH